MRLLLRACAVGVIVCGVCSTGVASGQDRGAEVDALLARMEPPNEPGCATGVFSHGKLEHVRSFGLANVAAHEPITENTVFNLASMSKQFTAATILLLSYDGHLNLQDDVRKFVPALPAYSAPITLDMLLHHTSGLRDYTTLLDLSGTSSAAHVSV